jgi:hypothetical protein
MTKLTIRRVLADLAQTTLLAPMATRAQMTDCAICGQTFDMRLLVHADHHGPEPHDPL